MTDPNKPNSKNVYKVFLSILKDDISGSLSLASAALSVSIFLIGGLFFFTYFFHIGYMPILDLKSSISLLIAVTLLGSFMILVYFLSMLFPVFQWISCYKIKRSENQRIIDSKNDFIVSFISLFLLWDSIFIYQFNTIFGILTTLIGFIIFIKFSSMPSNQEGRLKKIFKHKFLIAGYGCQSVFIGLFTTFILYTLFVTVSKNEQSLSNINEALPFFSGFLVLYSFMIWANIYIFNSWYDNKDIGISRVIKPLATVIFFTMLIPYFTGSANAIPYIAMRNLRLGAMENSTLVVDYKGCQILEKIDKSMLGISLDSKNESSQISKDNACSKNDKEAVYLIKNIDIQSTLGNNLFLKYPSNSLICKDNMNRIQEKCFSRNEKKFHISKENILSYFAEGEKINMNEP